MSSVLLTGAVGEQGSELVAEHKMLFSIVLGDSGERSVVLQWIEVCASLLIIASACSLSLLLSVVHFLIDRVDTAVYVVC